MNKTFNDLRKINVNDHVEKKNNLTYLSWAWAVDTLMQNDPMATWEFKEPMKFGETLMVFCEVTAFGKTIKMHLPVLDYKNKAVVNPDSFAVSNSMMRCLTKAIACFGIGLYIYSGEDLPQEDSQQAQQKENTWSMSQFQPSPEEIGVSDGVYRVPFGKYNKRALHEIDMKDLENYVLYLENKAAKDGKEITGVVKEFIDNAVNFINTFEQEVSFNQTKF